ncbi:hypothetical protein ILUMI_19323 [Ignelater luminosus]|uniref:Uncharacterized protein n=1 Tax=Ignelater luminosus TaxID=2038154 RepID=A0A8K0CGH4_IGNLU|nr:hypothetical protein ILUMI_19323 [Ignelater luminosus]
MDAEHVSLVLKKYAQLHALSFVLHDEDLEKFKEIRNSMDDMFTKFAEKVNYKLGVRHTSLKSLRSLQKDVDTEAYKIYKDHINNIDKILEDVKNAVNNDYVAVLHDIAWFLCTCSEKEVIEKLENYLRLYHNSLAAHLVKLGSNYDKVYPHSVFLKQWRKYARFGLTLATSIIYLLLSDESGFVDLNDFVETGACIGDALDYEIAKSDLYYDRQLKENIFVRLCAVWLKMSNASDGLIEYLDKTTKDLIQGIASENGLVCYEIQEDEQSIKWKGFHGTVIGVTLTCNDKTNKKKILNVVIKSPSKSDALRTQIILNEKYTRES